MTAPSSPLTIRMFGPLHVFVHGETMPRVRSRQVHWILALLVLRHGRSVSRSWLAGTLWPESDETRARQNLRDDLLRLRAALGPDAKRIQSPTRDTLCIDLEGADIDVVRFDRAIISGDPDSLRDAVSIYGADLLEGCYEEWVVLEREARATQYIAALEKLADLAKAEGNNEEAIRLLRQVESKDPLRDSIARRLMEALDASGDPAAAVAVYRALRERLSTELTTAPDAATTDLFQRIRERARSGTRAPSAPSLGASDSVRRESQSQDASPSVARPPHPLTELIGREQAVADVLSAISASRLVTLVGAGGVGKTRLAIEVANQVVGPPERVVVWIELAPLTASSLVLPAIGMAVGVEEQFAGEMEVVAKQVAKLLSKGSVLLILDNCEHLIESAAAAVEVLLQFDRSITVLATSRERLGLPGETVWRVPSLSTGVEVRTEGVESTLDQVLKSPACRLFYERAEATRPGFCTADDAGLIETICSRLDGIPLAIELAAARVATLTPKQIAQRLEDRFAILTSGARTSLPRQKTLQALIDWSYALLSEHERALLRRLSVFVDGWTLEAAEAVAAHTERESPSALDLISSLSDKSLVVVDECGGELRYRMLEMIRQYAGDKLCESGEEESARNGHLAYAISLGKGVAQGSGVNYDQIETEIGNFRAALTWAQNPTVPQESYITLVACLWPFWQVRGSHFEGCMHVQNALDFLEGKDSPYRESILRGAWTLAIDFTFRRERILARTVPALPDEDAWEQEYDQAEAALHKSLELHRRLDHKPNIVELLRCLSLICVKRRDYAQSLLYIEEASEFARALNCRLYLAQCLHEWGCVHMYEGAYSQARPLLEEAMGLVMRPGGDFAHGFAGNNLATTLMHLGESARAKQLFWEGLHYYMYSEYSTDSGSVSLDGVVWSLEGLAHAGMTEEEAVRAVKVLAAASTSSESSSSSPMHRWAQAEGALRATLGDAKFNSTFNSGFTLSLEGALLALMELDPSKAIT